VLKESRIATSTPLHGPCSSAIDGAKNKASRPPSTRLRLHDRSCRAASIPSTRAHGVAERRRLGDLILKTLNLCEKDAEIGPKLAQKFEHVLVDEFQDTTGRNIAGASLSSATGICACRRRRSIHLWLAGGDLRNILDFEAITRAR